METVTLLLVGVSVLILALLFTLFLYVVHSGLLVSVRVGAGPPPIAGFTVAYKFVRGPYKDVGYTFTEAMCIAPQLKAFGVYYDDPHEVAAAELRAGIGCILSEGENASDSELIAAFKAKDFRLFAFPSITSAVCTSFPFHNRLSVILGTYKVYPALSTYIEKHKLCGHPFLEIYSETKIHYVVPLAKQDDFYIPETEGKKSYKSAPLSGGGEEPLVPSSRSREDVHARDTGDKSMSDQDQHTSASE